MVEAVAKFVPPLELPDLADVLFIQTYIFIYYNKIYF